MKRGLLILIASVVIILGLGLIRTPEAPIGTVEAVHGSTGGVLLADLNTEEKDVALMGELELKDPTPLFLPTRWNSGQVDRTMTAERSAGASFGQIAPKWVFPDDENRLNLPDGVSVPDSAIATLDRMETRLQGSELTRRDDLNRPLPARAGFMEVVAVPSGKTVYRTALEADSIEDAVPAPIETMLAINSGGFWVRPIVAQVVEGGAVEFDRVNLVLREARLETFLEPGFYRILLGP